VGAATASVGWAELPLAVTAHCLPVPEDESTALAEVVPRVGAVAEWERGAQAHSSAVMAAAVLATRVVAGAVLASALKAQAVAPVAPVSAREAQGISVAVAEPERLPAETVVMPPARAPAARSVVVVQEGTASAAEAVVLEPEAVVAVALAVAETAETAAEADRASSLHQLPPPRLRPPTLAMVR
jgi:hypothetical protein